MSRGNFSLLKCVHEVEWTVYALFVGWRERKRMDLNRNDNIWPGSGNDVHYWVVNSRTNDLSECLVDFGAWFPWRRRNHRYRFFFCVCRKVFRSKWGEIFRAFLIGFLLETKMKKKNIRGGSLNQVEAEHKEIFRRSASKEAEENRWNFPDFE